jgi:hypothetical protein
MSMPALPIAQTWLYGLLVPIAVQGYPRSSDAGTLKTSSHLQPYQSKVSEIVGNSSTRITRLRRFGLYYAPMEDGLSSVETRMMKYNCDPI